LLDAQLLAQVYIELTGGRQIGLGLADDLPASDVDPASRPALARPFREPRPHHASDADLARHSSFLARIANPLWQRFTQQAERGSA
jgi:DNA polymerase-3 subunit epsilon